MSELDTPLAVPVAPEGVRIIARVKWFDPARGYGFVLPEGGGETAFLHISVLNRAGRHSIPDGAIVVCLVVPGPKGQQVSTLIEVRDSDPDAEEAAPPTTEMEGTVKWFKHDKGFGFVLPDDGGPDVFVHKSVVRHSGLGAIDTGQRLSLRVRDNPRGREAIWIGPPRQ